MLALRDVDMREAEQHTSSSHNLHPLFPNQPHPPSSQPGRQPGPCKCNSLAHIDGNSLQRARQASAFVLVQQQVGDALGDREAPPGLWADQRALLQHHLQQRMVERAQEVVVLQAGLIRLLGQPGCACTGAAEALDTTASLLRSQSSNTSRKKPLV